MLQSSELYKKEMDAGRYKNYIETSAGRRFYFAEPKFDIHEIAAALSKQCRFMGHTDRFYSVAEHCVLVADLMDYFELGDPLEGLLHDAHEAYCVDIASPLKVEIPAYKTFETILEASMRKTFNLPDKITDGCKTADWVALFVEANFMIPSKGADWLAPDGIRELADKYIRKIQMHSIDMGWPWQAAHTLFMEEYNARIQKQA